MKQTGNGIKRFRTLQELNLEDDFLFAKVMTDEEICKEVLEKILRIQIEKIEILQSQKAIDLAVQNRGIRLDIYVKDEKGTVYNVEIQAVNRRNLPKRTRYYQGNIDLDLMMKGTDFGELPKSIIIFICTFDYFEKGRHLYTFENRCVEDPELKLQDETQKIILNTKGYLEDVSQEVRDFLHYIEHTTEEAARKSSGTLVKNIQKKVEQVKRNRGLEVEFMTFEEKLKEEKKYSWEEGHEEGHKEGLAEKAISTAKKLKMAGVDIKTIADSVGLSEDEIRAL